MIYDISMIIEENMQVYKNRDEKKPLFINDGNFSNSKVYETSLKINMHTGTHVDYPLHILENGKNSSQVSITPLIGSCKVFDLTYVEGEIKKKHILKYDILPNDFILLKTKNSFESQFNFNFVYLGKEAAEYLKDKMIRGVGIDALGIERSQEGHPTHRFLLGNNIYIIEGLRLKDIKEDEYQLICLPLKIKGVEAALSRAVLVK